MNFEITKKELVKRIAFRKADYEKGYLNDYGVGVLKGMEDALDLIVKEQKIKPATPEDFKVTFCCNPQQECSHFVKGTCKSEVDCHYKSENGAV